MTKNRLEAFSDGVLAIIITIMVLELSLPAGDKFSDLGAIAPTLLVYLLSFFFVAIYWVNHHMIFHDVETVNLKILWSNIVWLFIISFIPFTTAWAGKHPSSAAPVTVYFADMALASITFHVMYYFIFKENESHVTPELRHAFRLDLRSILSLVIYTAAAAVGAFCPIAAYVVVTLVSLWWIVPKKKAKASLEKVAESIEKAEQDEENE